MKHSIAIELENGVAPVYQLKDLFELYKHKIKSVSSEDITERLHRTRFKESILSQIPGLVQQSKGKEVVLTLDGEIGKALFQASLYSSKDDFTVIADAARRIRKTLFLRCKTLSRRFIFGSPECISPANTSTVDLDDPQRNENRHRSF